MLDSLHRRPRGRALASVLSELTNGRVPDAPEPDPAIAEAAAAEQAAAAEAVKATRLLEALEAHRPLERGDVLGPPSRSLVARIDEEDVAELRRRLEPELEHHWNTARPVVKEHLKLILGVHYGVDSILEKTGLSRAEPPEDVHAMGRGPLAAGGDFWIADLLADAAERAGLELAAGMRALDFGCSSGRHLRVLQAWRGDVRWLGCDPNERAIGWASENLPGIEFFVSPQEPPLDLEPGSLDVVFAVSVWSHFGAGAAERWLAEMHRLLRPGGLLVFTTQGIGSAGFYLRIGAIPPEHATAIVQGLISRGHDYREAFGPSGDWGVKSEEWGMAYMTLEWLAERLTPDWSLALYEAMRIGENQDLLVLRREGRG